MDETRRDVSADQADQSMNTIGGGATSAAGDVTDQACQAVATMLMATYEQLDRLERLLGGTTSPSDAATSNATACGAHPSPPTRAAIVTALQVVDIVKGNLSGRDIAGIAVLERVQANLAAVMGTVAALLCDLTLPGSAGRMDLGAVVDRAQAVLDAFSADPAAPASSGTTPCREHR